jgi:hypothetical protein
MKASHKEGSGSVIRTLDPLSSDALYLYLFQYKAESTNFVSFKVSKYSFNLPTSIPLVLTKASTAIECSIFLILHILGSSPILSGDI